jgi:hypothetical protein
MEKGGTMCRPFVFPSGDPASVRPEGRDRIADKGLVIDLYHKLAVRQLFDDDSLNRHACADADCPKHVRFPPSWRHNPKVTPLIVPVQRIIALAEGNSAKVWNRAA